LRERRLDFYLMNATVAPVLGGEAVVVEAAAETHLDLYAGWQNQTGGPRWTSVDWDGFRLADDGGPSTAITAGEGTQVFARLLEAGLEIYEWLIAVHSPARRRRA